MVGLCGQTSDMALYSGHRVGDVGSIDHCRELSDVGAQFCVALGSALTQAPPIIGFCLPDTNCSKYDIMSFLSDNSTGDSSHIAQAFAASVQNNGVSIFCQGPDGVDNPYKVLGITMLAILLVVTTVVVFATTYDIMKKVSAKADLQLLLTGRSAEQVINLTDMPYTAPAPMAAEVGVVSGGAVQIGSDGETAVVSDSDAQSTTIGGAAASSTNPNPHYGTADHDTDSVVDRGDRCVANVASPRNGIPLLANEEEGSPNAHPPMVRSEASYVPPIINHSSSPVQATPQSSRTRRRRHQQQGYSPRDHNPYQPEPNGAPEHPVHNAAYRRTVLRKQIELRVEQIIDEIPDFQSLFTRFVLCFSLLAGMKRWRHFPASTGHSYLFHSVRTVAWMWLIVVDTYTYSALIPTFSDDNHGILFALMQRKVADAVAIGTLVLISGYIVIHQLEIEEEAFNKNPTAFVERLRQGHCKRWWNATKWYVVRAVKRWLRLVPLYAAVVFLTQSALLQDQGGPFWPIFLESSTLHMNCVQYSAANFAFINNLVPADHSKRCFPWTYYFAIEFQFFLLAPVVHYLHKVLPLKIYVPSFVLLAVGSLALRFISQDSCEEIDRGPQPDTLVPFGNDVEKPWSLFLPFAFGALLYYAHRSVLRKAGEMKMFGPETLSVLRHSTLHSTSIRDRCTFRLLLLLNYKRFRVVCIWSGVILSSGTVMLSWYMVGRGRDCEWQPRWFVTMATLPWCVGLVFLFLPMMFGYGGLLQKFLTHRLWVGSSKLVFGAYLVGPLVVAITNAIQMTPRSVNGVDFFYNAWGNITFSMAIALLFHLAIEQPAMFLTRDMG